MRLTLYTDYSLRVLLYLAGKEDEVVTISDLADFYKISRNHLVKMYPFSPRLCTTLTRWLREIL